MGKSREYLWMPFQTCLIISVSQKLLFFMECKQAASVNTVIQYTYLFIYYFFNKTDDLKWNVRVFSYYYQEIRFYLQKMLVHLNLVQ